MSIIKSGLTILSSDVLSLLRTINTSHLNNSSPGLFATATVDILTTIPFSDSGGNFGVSITGTTTQVRAIASDWAAADGNISAVIIGTFMYVLLYDNGTTTGRVYRYTTANLAAGGTLMTFSGQTFGTTTFSSVRMVADPNSNFYFTCKAGNSASQHILSKYTLSATTFTYVSDITCGSTSSNFDNFVYVDASINSYGFSNSDQKIRKYNSAGTLQVASGAYVSLSNYFMSLQSTTNAVIFIANPNTQNLNQIWLQ